MKTSIPPVLIAFTLVCFALSPTARALLPPPAPDGGYPGGNTAEGTNALFSRTNGVYNTAIGLNALYSNISGSQNTATGVNALSANTTGSYNTADGVNTLYRNTIGFQNTANGVQALFNNTTGNNNTANGVNTLYHNTTGVENTTTGQQALFNNTEGFANTANGVSTLFANTTGNNNTAYGYEALNNNITGTFNTALGAHAGYNITTADNVICIGANVSGVNVSNSCFIGNIRDVTTQNANAIPVLIDTAGQLGTMSSSARFKKEIKPMNQASEAVLALKPVTFHYKSDTKGTPQFGLIAEEVAAVNPDLVVRDKSGDIYTVRYDAVNAMLLNEFLKAHRKVEEQEATIMQLKKEMETVVAHLKEQDSKIQTVSDRIELGQSATQTDFERSVKADRIAESRPYGTQAIPHLQSPNWHPGISGEH